MSDVIMDRARAILHGQEINVVFPDAVQYAGEERWSEKRHKGHLKCQFCDAAVHYKRGAKGIAGQSDLARRQHFCTNKDQSHDDSCQWQFRMSGDRPKEGYDYTAGYKIFVNGMGDGVSPRFNEAASLLYSYENKKLVLHDPTLRRMEGIRINRAQDLVQFMYRADRDRLKKARIIHNGWDLTWEQFVVRYNRNSLTHSSRYVDLIDRIRASGQPVQPVLMEFDIDEAVKGTDERTSPVVMSREIECWGAGKKSEKRIVRPRAYLDGDRQSLIQEFAEAGKYLVLGYARSGSHKSLDYIFLSIKSPDQVAHTTLDEITAANALKYPR